MSGCLPWVAGLSCGLGYSIPSPSLLNLIRKPQTVTEPTRPELPHNPFSAAFASPPSPTSSRSTSPSPSHSLSLSTTPPSSELAYHEPLTAPLTSNAHSIHALATLSHSNHTLSPYTRELAHFAVRSGPPRPPVVGAGVGVARKGKRRRTYRIGAKPPPTLETQSPSGPAAFYPEELSPMSAEFDVRDMDMYFRRADGDTHSRAGSPNMHIRPLQSQSPIIRPSQSPSIRPSHMPLRHKVSSLAMSTMGG
ncbi:Mitochondrial distribution and morphology protein 34 [Mycena venus]|uniref:Mitochondrial distribution and morphology protein 34 n=1 Tax=Mycena venus TaxID=2733690 RepID=A0A8H7CY22_9AGAR|nr:Mitochondrial distribution and morphology protein 34 [Mycena venus]